MIFTEKTATEIIQKFSLSPGTFKTWKNRGTIPDKYRAESLPQKLVKENDLQAAQNIIRAFKTGKLVVAAIARLANVHPQMIKEVVDGKYAFNTASLLALKKAINTVRNDIKNILVATQSRNVLPEQTIKQIAKLLSRSEVSWERVFSDKVILDRFFAWKYGRRTFPLSDLNFFKSALLVFLTETTI